MVTVTFRFALTVATMMIYGTALLAICLLLGSFAGNLLGTAIGLDADVGGVGIAMLLLIVCCDQLRRRGYLHANSRQGIVFWSAIYIPVVVAMAASQNVVKAVNGGALAAVAGVLVVVLSFLMVPLISAIGNDTPSMDDSQPN